jgi:hypothetical protein
MFGICVRSMTRLLVLFLKRLRVWTLQYVTVKGPVFSSAGTHRFWSAGSGSRRAKVTIKMEKREEISSFEVLDVLCLRTEGFSCSFYVFYGGVGICELPFLISCNFFLFWVLKTPDPSPHLPNMSDLYTGTGSGSCSCSFLQWVSG